MQTEQPQPKNEAAGGASDVERVVSHLSTPDEIARFAFEGSHSILWQCVQAYRHGKYTWEQAMQVAAFTQAESLAILNKECVQLMNRMPATGMVANVELRGDASRRPA